MSNNLRHIPILASLVGLAGLVALPARAVTLNVFSGTLPPSVQVVAAQYEVDVPTGRVGLAVDFVDGTFGWTSFEAVSFSKTFPVPALRFDAARREILASDGDRSLVCASARKFLWSTYYRESGACRIVLTNEPTTQDDGVHRSTATAARVEIVLEAPRVALGPR
jgi:hypothetical protein